VDELEESEVDKLKAWFVTFLFGLKAAWNNIIHLPVIEPLWEIFSTQRVMLAVVDFGATVLATKLGLNEQVTLLLIIGINVFLGIVVFGLQREVLIETAMKKSPTREELEAIIEEAIKARLEVKPANLDYLKSLGANLSKVRQVKQAG
jgi:hypothetical protein